jgi:hypothetical protein
MTNPAPTLPASATMEHEAMNLPLSAHLTAAMASKHGDMERGYIDTNDCAFWRAMGCDPANMRRNGPNVTLEAAEVAILACRADDSSSPLRRLAYRLISRTAALTAARERISILEEKTKAGEAAHAKVVELATALERERGRADVLAEDLTRAVQSEAAFRVSAETLHREVAALQTEIARLTPLAAPEIKRQAKMAKVRDARRKAAAAKRSKAAKLAREERAQALASSWAQFVNGVTCVVGGGMVPDDLARQIRKESGAGPSSQVCIVGGNRVGRTHHDAPSVTVSASWLNGRRLLKMARREVGC